MNIQVTIKSNSKAARAIQRFMAEKAAFRKAVKEGTVSTYVKQSRKKFDTPVQVSN